MASEAPQLGKLIEPGAGSRDAVHVAIFPAYADTALNPGDHVDLAGGRDGTAHKVKWVPSGGLGIVDPYLPGPVQPGQEFYALLYPGTVVSLRHLWVHPAFAATRPPAVANG